MNNNCVFTLRSDGYFLNLFQGAYSASDENIKQIKVGYGVKVRIGDGNRHECFWTKVVQINDLGMHVTVDNDLELSFMHGLSNDDKLFVPNEAILAFYGV